MITNKNKVKAGILLSIISVGLLNLSGMKADSDIKRRYNPDLPILKDGWEGNVVIDGKFQNDTIARKFPLTNALKWQFSRNPQRKEKRKDPFQPQIQEFTPSSMSENSIVWLGHSSFLVNINGVRLIFDPCFFNMPISTKRDLPCSPDSLTAIDYLLVSHDHRDHFDKKSVKLLAKNNPDMKALLPLGGDKLFGGKKLRNIKTQEAGWYQEYQLEEDIRIILLPAIH